MNRKVIEVIIVVIVCSIMFMILQLPLYLVTRVIAFLPIWIQRDLVHLFDITPLSEGNIVLITHIVINILAVLMGLVVAIDEKEKSKNPDQAGRDE